MNRLHLSAPLVSIALLIGATAEGYAMDATSISGSETTARGAVERTPPGGRGLGPRVPVGPQDSIRCPIEAVLLKPSDTIPWIVAHKPGTVYCLTPGIYQRFQLIPKAGDSYIGEKGAILDGQNVTRRAFASKFGNVTIKNLEITRYTAPSQDAPINNCGGGGKNWLIMNNDIHGNAGAGVEICGDGTRIIANRLRDNEQEGFNCADAMNVEITDNEIVNNNPHDAVDPKWEAGGGKCARTKNLTVSFNNVHDNHGPGLWTDIDNENTRYESNVVWNNWEAGIFHEISWDGVIAHNYLANNGHSKFCQGWLWCGGITIAASGGVNGKIIDVFDNVIIASPPGNSISLIQQKRDAGKHGTYLVQNVHVHHNVIVMAESTCTGAVTDYNDEGLFTRHNVFDHNEYRLRGGDFRWRNGNGDFRWFQAQGQEVSGTVSRD
jgi:parallel beta-helix repeat protein